MIKTVVEMQGKKRFKKVDNDDENAFSPNDLNMEIKETTNVKEIFRKLNATSAYTKQFGGKPAAEQDFKVLKEKQFAKLACAQILKPHIQVILNRWLLINDQDKFTGRIFFTVRDMFTVVKSKLADVPTSQDHHASHHELAVTMPRFDKVIQGIGETKRTRNGA